jgi:hypothetical protein
MKVKRVELAKGACAEHTHTNTSVTSLYSVLQDTGVKPGRKTRLGSCFHAGYLFNPEDGGGMFLRNVS